MISLWGSDANNAWVVSEQGTLLRSNNGAWSLVESGTSLAFHDVWGADAKNVWAVGEQGYVNNMDANEVHRRRQYKTLGFFEVTTTSYPLYFEVGGGQTHLKPKEL